MVTTRLTLLFYITILSLLLNSLALDLNVRHNHSRMIRKRVAQDNAALSVPPVNVAPDPTGADANAPAATDKKGTKATDSAAAAGSNTAAAAPTDSAAGAQNSATASNNGGILGGLSLSIPILGGGNPTQSSSSSVVSSSSASSTAVSSSSSPFPSSTPAVSTPVDTPTPSPVQEITSTNGPVTVTSTDTSQQAQSSADVTQNTQAAVDNSPHVARNTIIAIAAIAGAIGLAVLIWTVIRKWKFSPSSDFEDRLNPIDWNPSNTSDDGAPNMAQRRRASIGSNRSFGSADVHSVRSNIPTYGAVGVVGNGNGSMISDLPNHDFTAGPAGGNGARSLAPLGGYADLRRGPSPAPTMEHPSLLRAGSGRSPYDAAAMNGYNNGGGQYGGY